MAMGAITMAIWQSKASLLSAVGVFAACLLAGCGGSPPPDPTPAPEMVSALQHIKASNTDAGDLFGLTVALSSDGSTLAVGAPQEDSIATGVNGDQGNTTSNAGAVYVFTRNGNAWVQQAYLKGLNTESFDLFGTSVALSADGSTLAVGAIGEDSDTSGIDPPANNAALSSGAVYVFSRSAGNWNQQAYVKASNTGADDLFGGSVTLSASGDRLAVGAYRESSDVTGVDSALADNDAASQAGAVYVFLRQAGSWSQEAYVKASNTGTDDGFGTSVSLSGDGNTLAVGSINENSDGHQGNNAAPLSGAVYVFRHNGTAWSQQAYVKASTIDTPDQFGASVALSANGDTLAVGAINESSNAIGIGGNQGNDPAGTNAGAAYVFVRTAGLWSQQAYVKASNTGKDDFFGTGVALSADGNRLAVSALAEASNATGLNGNQLDNSATEAGAAYVFARSGVNWRQLAYVKASNTRSNSWFGYAMSLSGDGQTLAVGAPRENSKGDPSDTSAAEAGAAYVVSVPN
ncbi:integrin [Hydrogenophaga sp. 2FB]|uniref:integrin n=1 Tax=Hydrogenophaga sp. 2FB TaxID=2502187 RepID=UPI0010F7178F|nr:integrin [Hydrogenophaga sp. 2FB]